MVIELGEKRKGEREKEVFLKSRFGESFSDVSFLSFC